MNKGGGKRGFLGVWIFWDLGLLEGFLGGEVLGREGRGIAKVSPSFWVK